MFSEKDIWQVANYLGIDFSKFSFEDFATGVNIELEHGVVNSLTNITNNNLLVTAKIALAHLNEFSDYYNKDYGLPALERALATKKKFR